MLTKPGPVTWESLKQELMMLPKDTLADMLNGWLKTYWSLQNYWMVYTEELFGFETAATLDERVWSKLAPIQAQRIRHILHLGDDLQALAALLKFTATQWAGAGFAWAFTEVSAKRLRMVVYKCPMGTYRKAQQLELLPCKHIASPLYITLAKTINDKIDVRCVHAHPDPPLENVMCQWEFVMNDGVSR
jgi:hypothetical protein